MRIVHGIDSARRALSDGRTLDLASVPTSFADTAERIFGARLTPTETVTRIIDVVRHEGDAGVLRLAHAIEGSRQRSLEVSPEQIEASLDSVDPRLVEALQLAADRIRTYHEASSPQTWMDFSAGYGALSTPCETAGVYVPGGSAPLPSTVLMTAIPARVAGVRNVFLWFSGRGERTSRSHCPGRRAHRRRGQGLRGRRSAGNSRNGVRHRNRSVCRHRLRPW